MKNTPSEDYTRLLEDDDSRSASEEIEAGGSCGESKSHARTRLHFGPLGANFFSLLILVLLVYNAVVLTLTLVVHGDRGTTTPVCAASPPTFQNVIDHDSVTIPSLKDALKYDERSEWTRGMHNPWNLPPSDELDEAWKDLLYPLNLRVSGTELDLVGENRTNAARVTGGDYLGVMGVYHNLHCLNALRVQLHWDYYEAKSLKLSKIASNVSISGHIAHCIDSIRQALTCHPNMAVAVSDYVNDPSFYVSEDVRNSATVQCVNWDSLHGWAKQRALVAGEYKFLPGPWHKSPDAKNPKDW